MATAGLFKDCGEIYARVFDHRPVIQQEINFFLREFEERRQWREEVTLKASLDLCHQLGQDQVPQAVSSLQKCVPDMLSKLKTANELCSGILDREHKNSQAEWLKQQRNSRVREWVNFMDRMCVKSAAVDEEFNNDVKRVEAYYTELEDKLKIAPSSPTHSYSSGASGT